MTFPYPLGNFIIPCLQIIPKKSGTTWIINCAALFCNNELIAMLPNAVVGF
ncbi:MAG TPA: hypothetical protein VH415_03730 [Nitrososphaeraceae archaeon]|jgi:hypothetical protein